MPKMSPEQRAELERQLQEDDNAANEDDFEVEFWNEKGAGGRMPYHKARKYFQDNFGIDLDPPPSDPNAGGNTGNDPDPNDPSQRPSGRYFGSNRK